MMNEDTIVTPPRICGSAEVKLAHRQMRLHRACRIEQCAWKWVAYYTLVRRGRIVPQELSPRERAHSRGIAFPIDAAELGHPRDGIPDVMTFQQVLDGLARLALPATNPGNGCAAKGERPWARGTGWRAFSPWSGVVCSPWSGWRVCGRSVGRVAPAPPVSPAEGVACCARWCGRRRGRAIDRINRSRSLMPIARCSCIGNTTVRVSALRSRHWSRLDASPLTRRDSIASGEVLTKRRHIRLPHACRAAQPSVGLGTRAFTLLLGMSGYVGWYPAIPVAPARGAHHSEVVKVLTAGNGRTWHGWPAGGPLTVRALR